MSELEEFGYMYEGMDEISLEQARRILELGAVDLYILYDDNTESLVENAWQFLMEIEDDVKFGIENQYKKENYVVCFVNKYGEEQREIVDYKDIEHLEELKEMYKQKFNDVEILSFKEADAGGVGRPLLEWEEIIQDLENDAQPTCGIIEVDLEPKLIDDYTFGVMTLRDTESGKESSYTIWADREDPDDPKTIMALGDMGQEELDEVFEESLNVATEDDVDVSNYIESLYLDDLFSSEQIRVMEKMHNYVSKERFFDVDYEDINSTVLIINDVDTNMNVRKFIENEEKMERFEESYNGKGMKQKEEGIEL